MYVCLMNVMYVCWMYVCNCTGCMYVCMLNKQRNTLSLIPMLGLAVVVSSMCTGLLIS